MPLLCSGPEKQPTGPISAFFGLAASQKRPEKNMTATWHGSWQGGWLKQGSRGQAGEGISQHHGLYIVRMSSKTDSDRMATADLRRKIARPGGLTTNFASVVRDRPRVRIPVTPISRQHPPLVHTTFFFFLGVSLCVCNASKVDVGVYLIVLLSCLTGW